MFLISSCSFLCLVSLRREILFSRVALVTNFPTVFPLDLTPHIKSSVCAAIQTRGISTDSSAVNSSLKRLAGLTVGSYCLKIFKSQVPISWVLTQVNRQWARSAVDWLWQSLQTGEVFNLILASLSSVGRSWCRSFQRKVVASDPIPFSLARLQLVAQSVVGDATSALHGLKILGMSSGCTMVMLSSTSTVYHCETVMVVMLRGVVSLSIVIHRKSQTSFKLWLK